MTACSPSAPNFDLPILNRNYTSCHGSIKQAGDLSFIYREQALAAITPGKPETSGLIARITTDNPYRNWLVRAFNDDMPFDEFTVKQIAGDLLPERTNDDLVATICHRNSERYRAKRHENSHRLHQRHQRRSRQRPASR